MAERKYKTSTHKPDADNAAVGKMNFRYIRITRIGLSVFCFVKVEVN